MVKPKYYSQAGQDAWVCELFNFKRNGFFVDIGAYDGVKFSNSYTLEQQFGWKGICVEANAQTFKELCKVRSSQNINTAVTDRNGMCVFIEDDMYGRIVFDNEIIKISKPCPSKTIGTILSECNAPAIIDYLSLDIEGGEFIALSVFPFDKYKIRALTVEHNFYNSGPGNKNKIYDILTEAGYTRVKEVSADGLHFEDWYTKNI